MALFSPETIILHRVSTEYLPFSMVLQNILCQAQSGAPQPILNGTKNSTRENKKHNTARKQQQQQQQQPKLSQDKKNIFQAYVIRCYHYKNQYGLQYGRKVETGTQT